MHNSPQSSDGVFVDLTPDSPVTVVAFGGLTGDGEEPVFEFFRFLSELDVKRTFLRDHEQAWYQLGVRGAASSFAGIERHLRDLLGAERLRHAIFTGGSAGGFAALYFGSRLGVAQVHAFAPQTYVSRPLRKAHKDFRWQRQINRMWAEANRREACFDIKGPVRRANRRRDPVSLCVHVGEERRDLTHANRLRRVPGVELRRYPIPTHAVARHLHESGRLEPVFERAIAEATPPI
jgi:hypothetical protein